MITTKRNGLLLKLKYIYIYIDILHNLKKILYYGDIKEAKQQWNNIHVSLNNVT